MLAIAFACEKFDTYIDGIKDCVEVQSDHQPLQSSCKKSIHKITKRLQRMRLRPQKYNFKITFTTGKDMKLAHTLSRAYLNNNSQSVFSMQLEKQLERHHINISKPITRTDRNWKATSSHASIE